MTITASHIKASPRRRRTITATILASGVALSGASVAGADEEPTTVRAEGTADGASVAADAIQAASTVISVPAPEVDPSKTLLVSSATTGSLSDSVSARAKVVEPVETESADSDAAEEDDSTERSEAADESASTGNDSSASDDEADDESSNDSAPSGSTAGKGSSILETARSGIGVPYVYGGADPSGWDCSGFTQWVYAQHGISLPHSASGQKALGTVISKSEARPGDLVVTSGHVGIYAGGNTMVDAGNSRVDTSERNIYSGSWVYVRI